MNTKLYNINNLNKRVELQQLENIDNSDEKQWKTIKKLWCNIENITNTLINTHEILENKNIYQVIIRKFTIIDKDMRIKFNDLLLYIKHINILDNNYIALTCEEIGE